MISKQVLEAFNVKGDGYTLDGGQGKSVKYEDIALKPVEDEEYYSFTSEIFNKLKPINYRVSKSILSINNKYVEYGYGATKYEPGYNADDKVKEKLMVSNELHKDLKKLNINKLKLSHDPWTCANNVLWRGYKLPKEWDEDRKIFLESILSKLEKLNKEYQIIHGDLSGNILFHENLSPLVIDFSPTIAPKEYADAIIICDSIAYKGADLSVVDYISLDKDYKSFIQYAVAFRVLTTAFMEDYTYESMIKEWMAYKDIWNLVS